ncbi:MAG TPA: hypothetical protein PLN90_04260 [Polyangiaceae bacterium]|nr:hypothetical protein [Polyangiaceae bacterium]
MRIVIGLGVVMALALGSCAPASPSKPAGSGGQEARTGVAASGVEQVDAATQGMIDRMLERVSGMRGLSRVGVVRGRVIDRATMIRQVQEQVRGQVPPGAIRGEQLFLSSFGFIPEDFDYEGQVYRLIESQLAGYYDPERKALFIMEDLGGSEVEVTLAHELVHALQDQHYDLGSRLKYQQNANDKQAAIHCLAEGDATSLMLDFTLEPGGGQAFEVPDEQLRLGLVAGMGMSSDVAGFPRVIRESLLAPYVDGVLFVHGLRRRGGWELVDEAWKQPPSTTEQVLHLEKYMAREPAEQVEGVPAPSAQGWQVVHQEVYGEQGLRIAFEDWLPRRAAARAAEGWAGDKAIVWENRDLGVIAAAWRIRFGGGEVEPSQEGKEAFTRVASAKGGGGVPSVCWVTQTGRAVLALWQGREVVLLSGPGEKGDPSKGGGCDELGVWGQRVSNRAGN